MPNPTTNVCVMEPISYFNAIMAKHSQQNEVTLIYLYPIS